MDEKTKDILEWIICIVVAVVLAIIIRYFVGTPTVVKQVSMYPTLKQNDRLILSRINRTTKTLPNRGDIITFEAPVQQYEYSKDDIIAKYDNQQDWGFFKKFAFNEFYGLYDERQRMFELLEDYYRSEFLDRLTENKAYFKFLSALDDCHTSFNGYNDLFSFDVSYYPSDREKNLRELEELLK